LSNILVKLKNEHDSDLELTEKQKREAQLKSDAAAAMDLFGLLKNYYSKLPLPLRNIR
jgi:hypothetical protein